MRGGLKIRRNLAIFLATALAVAVLDQITKAAVGKNLFLNQIIEVIPGFFDLVYFKNPGAAFGIFNEGGVLRKLFLIGTTSAALVILAFLVKGAKSAAQTFAFSLIAGGAVGNLIDRVMSGEVVDFLYFHVKGFYWPAFNVADMAITAGVVLAIAGYYLTERGKVG